jgi:hypothetical protein
VRRPSPSAATCRASSAPITRRFSAPPPIPCMIPTNHASFLRASSSQNPAPSAPPSPFSLRHPPQRAPCGHTGAAAASPNLLPQGPRPSSLLHAAGMAPLRHRCHSSTPLSDPSRAISGEDGRALDPVVARAGASGGCG